PSTLRALVHNKLFEPRVLELVREFILPPVLINWNKSGDCYFVFKKTNQTEHSIYYDVEVCIPSQSPFTIKMKSSIKDAQTTIDWLEYLLPKLIKENYEAYINDINSKCEKNSDPKDTYQ